MFSTAVANYYVAIRQMKILFQFVLEIRQNIVKFQVIIFIIHLISFG